MVQLNLMSSLLLLLLPILTPLTTAWTTPAYLNLDWPPLLASGYTTNTSDTSTFPCSLIPITPSIPRVNFPITSGHLQFSLYNTTHALPGYEFIVSIYLGQISSDTSADQSAYSRFDTLIWKEFKTGTDCTGDELDASKLVGMALGKTVDDVDTIGLNATFGLRLVLVKEGEGVQDFEEGRGGVLEEMWQCGYITFAPSTITTTENLGYCNSRPRPSFAPLLPSTSLSPSLPSSTPAFAPLLIPFPSLSSSSNPSSTPNPFSLLPPPINPQPGWTSETTSVYGSATSTPVPAFNGTANSAAKTNHAGRMLAAGIGIGVTIALGLLFAIVLLVLLKRRRDRRARGTMAAGFWVEGRRDGDGGMAIGDRDSKSSGGSSGKGGESSGRVSVTEEPLPVYEEVVKGSGGWSGAKGGGRGGSFVEIELREVRGPEV